MMVARRTLGVASLHALVVALLVVGTLFVSWAPVAYAGNTDTPLQPVQTYGQCTDNNAYQVKVAGVGMRTQSTGTINLSLPTTATVVKAWLYWNGDDPSDSSGGGDGTIQFEGSTFSAPDAHTSQTGGPAFWEANRFSYAYKADVTSLVNSSKTSYTFVDPFSGDPNDFDIPNGAALVVIYQDSAVTTPTVVETWEGMDIAQGSSMPAGSEGIAPIRFDFDPAAVDRTLNLTTIVGGIGSGEGAQVYYLVGSGTPPSGDIYAQPGVITKTLPAQEDGERMTTYDDTVTVPANAEWVIVQVRSPDTGGAQLQWLAETFQMVAACPKLSVTKTLTTPAGGLAHVGDAVSFQVTVENTGNTLLTSIPLTDTFGSGYLEFNNASSTPDGTTPAGTLTWNDLTVALGDLGPGNSLNVTVNFTATNGTQSLPGDVTTNTALVSGAKDQNNNTAPDDSDSANVEISNPSFTMTKIRISPADPDSTIVVGERVTYTIAITNTGDTALTVVPLQDTYDTSKLDFVSATVGGYSSDEPNGTVTWSDLTGSGSLAPGQSVSVNVTLEATATTGGAQTVNTARVSGATDENSDTLGDQTDTAYVRITNPCVNITKTLQGDHVRPLGSTVTYQITVANCGDTILSTIPVTDTFPTAYLDYDSASPSPTTVDESGGTLAWADVTGAGTLGVGGTINFTVSFTATASSNPNTLTNTACTNGVTDSNGDSPSDDCDDDTTLITTNPALTITKRLVGSSPVLVGDAIQFTIIITNTGDTVITDLPLSDTFNDTKLQFVSASPSQDSTGTGSVSWNDLTGAGSLAVGASTSVTVNFTALASTSPGVTTNTATVSGAQDENGDTVPTVDDSDDVQVLTPASIGNYVWHDQDGDGIQDTGEPGLQGVTVKLYDSSDVLQDTTTTDINGVYTFTHLFPGDYYIMFVKPTGYEFTAKDQGSNDAVDSDADQSTGKTLSEGENDTSWDAGLYQPATLGNYVWEDINGDGIQDTGESGIPSVTVNLHGAGPNGSFGDGDDVSDTTTTNTNGVYQFTNLAPGKYYLEFVTPSGYAITLKDQGSDDAADSDADQTTGKTATTVLVSGETDLTWDAGMYQPATIGDFVWQDSDGDQAQDPGEGGISNVTLSLYESGGSLLATTTTDSNGIYTFTNLAPGTYTVTVTTPSGYVHTTPTTLVRTVQSGDVVDDADFGFISPTAVMLQSFDADVQRQGVEITWTTLREQGVTGYRVQRATVAWGPWTDLGDGIIAAQGTEASGATYTYLDTNVQPGFTYYYRLVSVPDGQVFGPVRAYVPKADSPGGAEAGYRLFVPFISR